jgi:cellulose synthase/poly-beta-1,6-N-acetylglucosamine synthase-like glycosyltransferase
MSNMSPSIVMVLVGLLALAISLHPYVTYPLSLVLFRALSRRPRPAPPALTAPSISILCCCHNEESVIVQKAKNCLEMAAAYGGDTEILFYLDGCTDKTEALLAAFGDKVKVVANSKQAGKSVGMASLAASATGQLLVFTDTNTFMDQDALTALSPYFSDPKIGCVCAHLEITNSNQGPIAWISAVYWRFEEYLKRLESETGTSLMADGGFFAIRRQLHSKTPPDIIDDMWTSMNVVLAGYRVVTSRAVRAREVTTPERGDEFRRKIRIACRAFNCYRLLAPRLHRSTPEIVYKFYSHKLTRWLSLPIFSFGLFFILVGFSIAGHWLLLGAMCASLGCLIPLAQIRRRPFSTLSDAVLLSFAVSLGIFESLRGRRYKIWTPAASGR